jgi:outer membrane lipoprotein SlyB
MKLFKLIAISASVGLLAACQPNLDSNSYDYYGGQSGHVREAVVKDIQYNVNVRRNSGVGTIAGGIAGGAVGSNLGGGSGAIGLVGTIGGAVLGGMAGNAVEGSAGSTKATLYIIKLHESGRMLSVIQQNRLPLCKGDHVYLIGNNERPRLILNDSYYSSGEHSRTGCFKRNNA